MKNASQRWLGLLILFLCVRAWAQPAIPNQVYDFPTNFDTLFGGAPIAYTTNLISTPVDSEPYYGNALILDTTNLTPAYLNYNVLDTSPTTHRNIDCASGTVLFYFAPNWASVSQGGLGPQGQMLTISNYSFEIPSTSTWTSEAGIPGWNVTGSYLSDAGVWNTTAYGGQPIGLAPDGIQVGWINGNGQLMTVSQTLTNFLQPNNLYTLSIQVGGRTDGYNPGTNYSVSLYAGTNLLASVPPVAPPVGSWTNLNAAYTSGSAVPSGENLQIVIATSETELDFDDVQLTKMPARTTPQMQQLVISNYSFEFPSTTTWTSDGILGWTFAGTSGGGVFNPELGTIEPIPDGVQAGWINADGTPTTASQTLTNLLQPDSTYTLNIAVGGYSGGIYNPGTNYSVSLYAGTNWLASVTPVVPPSGSWTNLQATYTSGDYVPSGANLEIVIGTSQTQLDFDNVQLNVTPYPGYNAYFIGGGDWSGGSPNGLFTIYADAVGSNLYFGGVGAGTATTYASAPISWSSNTFHQIGVEWTTGDCEIYLDGLLAATGDGVTVVPTHSTWTNGFFIGSDNNGYEQARGAFWAMFTWSEEYGGLYTNGWLDTSNDLVTWQGGLGGGGFGGMFGMMAPGYIPGFSYVTNYADYADFWLDIQATNSNSEALLTIQQTQSNLTYAILTNSTLDPNLANWGVWQTLTASNSVIVAPLFAIGTNSVFFDAQLVLITGPGDLPDWWEMEYGLNPGNISSSTNGVSNDYADPAGDGWSNLQKFQNGWNPNTFYTPPAPQLSVTPISDHSGVTITWNANQGAVTGYTIFRNGSAIATVSASTLSYVDTSAGIASNYQVRANYASGNSSLSPDQSGADPNLVVWMALCRGPQSQYYLLAPNIPKAVTSLLIEVTNLYTAWPYAAFNAYSQPLTNFIPTLSDPFFELSVTNFVNGRYAIPTNLLPYFSSYLIRYEAVGANGTFGPIVAYVAQDFAQDFAPDDAWLLAAEDRFSETVPFLDGTTQLQQNLVFQLESADENGPLQFTVNATTDPRAYPGDEVSGFSGIAFASSYAYANFHQRLGSNPAWIYEFRPFEDNYFYRNFVVNSSADVTTNGSIASGITYASSLPSGDPFHIQAPSQAPYAFPDYAYALLGGTNAITPLLTTNAQYIYSAFPTSGNIGVSWIDYTNLTLASGQFNSFGLDYQSVIDYYTDGTTLYSQTLSPGAVVPDNSYYVATQTPFFYAEVAAPSLNTIGFYFAQTDRDYIPGDSGFNITNGIGPVVASVGVPLDMGAWAEQEIVNGNGNQRAFLELYWDKAFTIDTNGSVTTNQTGILSEYGEFFPTDPALVVLTTKSNSTTSAGQIDIPIIGLYTDANHDGVIDTSFNGPDFVTPFHPFRFWVNDDNDSGDTGGNDIPGYPALLGQRPNGLSGVVNGARDLIDFFPVYVDIGSVLQEMKTSSAYASLQFRLSQPDGALNFVYTSLQTNFFTAYQTDLAYLYANTNVTQITSTGVVLNSAFVQSTTNGGGIILVEAWTNTTAPLILDVLLGTNVIAQAQLPLSITGVEQMFRHKNLTSAVLSATDGSADRLTDTDAPNAPDDNGTNFIFVHGYNVNPDQARGWQSEIFKRLYWSGSHARFYGVTWYAYDSQKYQQVTINLQTNIVHAFQTAPALNTFLNSLPGTNVLMAHSLGNMLVLSTLNDCSNATINTFFMMDAAVALEAIDGTNAINTNMVPSDWLAYPPRTWASEWFNLFSSTDGRSQLTWSNRLASFDDQRVYNFYSSGEEVLRNYYGAPLDLVGLAEQAIKAYVWSNTPFAANLWGLEEKEKGRMSSDAILSSSHEGWGYNTNYGTISSPPNTTVVSALTSSQLQTNPVFNTSFDGLLFTAGTTGSTYAHSDLNAILSDAIPAVSWATGANHVGRLAQTGQPDQNFDMQASFESGWASGRPAVSVGATASGEWHHSDAREMAYPYTHELFDAFVGLGNLK